MISPEILNILQTFKSSALKRNLPLLICENKLNTKHNKLIFLELAGSRIFVSFAIEAKQRESRFVSLVLFHKTR